MDLEAKIKELEIERDHAIAEAKHDYTLKSMIVRRTDMNELFFEAERILRGESESNLKTIVQGIMDDIDELEYLSAMEKKLTDEIIKYEETEE